MAKKEAPGAEEWKGEAVDPANEVSAKDDVSGKVTVTSWFMENFGFLWKLEASKGYFKKGFSVLNF